MEQRKHPRIQLPLLVSVTHPSFKGGSVQALARDVSEGGIFVHLEDHKLNVGSKLKLTLQNTNPLDAQATPTVDVIVRRITESGLGLEFTNKTGKHLWSSVERIRDELAIGRDYFQIRQDLVAISPDGELLVVQRNGKWGFPNHYLIVGEDWREAATRTLKEELGVTPTSDFDTVDLSSRSNDAVPEAALFWLTHSCNVADKNVDLKDEYRQSKWVSKLHEIEELTFAIDSMRAVAIQVLESLHGS
jgi:ADP-ribose pyrophosphatase YjhB (NUDIX family)